MYSCHNEKEVTSPSLLAEEGEQFSGGSATVFDQSTNAFGLQAPELTGDLSLQFFVGNSLFTQNWVTAPASTTARDGLGPLFNSRACSGCHPKDGRGKAPLFDGDTDHGLLLRLSIPGYTPTGEPQPVPNYGGQLQDQALLGVMSEGQISILYQEQSGQYADGTNYSLRKPVYSIKSLQYGELDPATMISPRVGQQVYGLGLLEAISETTILSYADVLDSNHDGISGKPNYVWSVITQQTELGRFGWKANVPTLRQQTAGAANGDMGLTSSLFPEEDCPSGISCDTENLGGSPEISDNNLDAMVLYVSTLAVPARRNWQDQEVLLGKETFNTIGCAKCHIPTMKTASHEFSVLANQTIRPYTDLLLHDMGDELADHRPDFQATGSEWRTPPLWGIGLIQTVNGHTNLLHDGRARNLEEAILWHGGEAETSRNDFKKLPQTERENLLKFLRSL